MKVLYVTPFYNGDIDGRFGRFTDWTHHLRDTDDAPFHHRVAAFTVTNPDDSITSKPMNVFGDGDELWGSALNRPEYVLNTPRICRDIRSYDPDVVHVLTLDSVVYPVARFCSRTSTPLVVGPDVQGYFPTRDGAPWNRSGLGGIRDRMTHRYRQLLAHLAPSNTKFIALSEYHRENVSLVSGRAPVELVSPGVDDIFHPEDAGDEDESFNLLYVGDLSEYKGYPLFLEALTTLPPDIDVSATVLGIGDEETDQIRALGLSDVVEVGGFVDRGDLPQYYRDADLFVMPSIDEHGPNTVVESLACGTPVAVTSRKGIDEYHPTDAGLTFERTVEGLAKVLEDAYERRDDLQTAARRHAESFHVRHTLADLDRIYRSLLDT